MTSAQDLQRLHNRVKRHQSKPKIKRSPEYYQGLIEQYNKPNASIRHSYADATKDNLFNMRRKFMRSVKYASGDSKSLYTYISIRFCNDQLQQDWRSVILNCSRGIMLAFLRHIYDESRVKKRSMMQQYIAQFKMLFNQENGRHMDTNDGKEALKVSSSLIDISYIQVN